MKSYFIHTQDMALASKEGTEPFYLKSEVDAEIKKLRECIAFYGNKDNWLKYQHSRFVGGDGSWVRIDDITEEYIGGGKRARDLLEGK